MVFSNSKKYFGGINMTILDRLFELMNERNLKPSQVTKDIGIANSSFSDWKKGKGSPSLDAVTKLAAYFNVSVDYIVNGIETTSLELSSQNEIVLIQNFRKLTPTLQSKLLIYLNGMVDALSPTVSTDIEKRLSV